MSTAPPRPPSGLTLAAAVTVVAGVLAACATATPSVTPSAGAGASSTSRPASATPPTPSPTLAVSAPVAIADVTADFSRPSLATDPTRDRAYLAWTTSPSDTEAVSFIAASSDGGRTWADPVQIPGRGEFWPVLRVTADGTLVVAWTHWQLDVLLDPKDQYSNAAWTYVARSTDGGRTLSEPVKVEAGTPKVAHYYMNLAVSPDGRTVTTSWFDYTPFSIPSLPQPGREAVEMWAATSHDGGASFGEPRPISTDTCVCCMPSGVVLAGHPGFVFRGWQAGGDAGDLRNPTMVLSTDAGDAWAAPTTVHDDAFLDPVCPHVGLGGVVDSGGLLHVSWWTGAEGRAGFWYSTSADGSTFTPPLELAPQVEDPHDNDAALGVDLAGTAWATTIDPGPLAADGSADPAKSAMAVWSIDPDGVKTSVPAAGRNGRAPQIGGLHEGALLTYVDAAHVMQAVRIGS